MIHGGHGEQMAGLEGQECGTIAEQAIGARRKTGPAQLWPSKYTTCSNHTGPTKSAN